MKRLAGSATNPADYAMQCLPGLPPALPYPLDSEAAFVAAGFNARGLADDVMDVMLALTTNYRARDGVAPDQRHMQAEFPYFGEPYARPDKSPVQCRAPKGKGGCATTELGHPTLVSSHSCPGSGIPCWPS